MDGNDQASDLSRHQAIKLGAAATVAVSLGLGDVSTSELAAATRAAQGAAPSFLTVEEFAVLDELSEMIIPTDAHSPGARAAKVAAFIDARLAEAWDPSEKTDWREGLRLVETVSSQISGKTFMQSSPDERLAALSRLAQNESNPQRPEEKFFATMKSRVIHAYYTSEIGIKQEMEYKGNTYLTDFVGTDVGT